MAETPTPNAGIIPIASIQNVIDSISNLRFSGVVTSIIFVTTSLPITKLCLGTLYKKQCSAQTTIPTWLVTSGFRGLFCIFITLSIVCTCLSIRWCFCWIESIISLKLGFAVLTDRYCRKTSSSLLLCVSTLIIVISAFFNLAWSILVRMFLWNSYMSKHQFYIGYLLVDINSIHSSAYRSNTNSNILSFNALHIRYGRFIISSNNYLNLYLDMRYLYSPSCTNDDHTFE